MSATLGRIGKSLIKYFKPVRVALPHDADSKKAKISPENASFNEPQGQSQDPNDSSKEGAFRLLKFKQSNKAQGTEESTELDSVAAALPPKKTPTHWLELVVHLLSACRKASEKVRKRIGIETYRKTLAAKSKNKLRTLGSIVDTTTIVVDTENEDETKRVA